MCATRDEKDVREQYKDASKLNTRRSLHDKYSVNRQGFGSWIVSHYRIEPGMRVLELGCGTGSMWKGRQDLFGPCAELVLTDLSEGMVEAARANVGAYANVTCRVADIQDIPYGPGRFDAVIANMMLYHVPDLKKGLAEVRRVLKEGGSFYCATYGENGIVRFFSDLLKPFGAQERLNKNFTLQSGGPVLAQFFSFVERAEYADHLEVTDLDDLLDYLYSLTGMAGVRGLDRAAVKSALARHAVDGVLKVPKEYGMFLCR